jgi:hypothetical protein
MRHFTIILVVLNFSNCEFLLYSVYPLSFETKRGSIFCFGPGMYFQTGQLFFVPKWSKGEFVSILYWQHYDWQKHFI